MYNDIASLPSRCVEAFQGIQKRLDADTGCLIWLGSMDRHGYGRVHACIPGGRKLSVGAHRMAYLIEHRTIPANLVLDHLCHNRICVNVAHLEAVTNAENLGRTRRTPRTHCKLGHLLDPVGGVKTPRGRRCVVCQRRRAKEWKLRQRTKRARI